MPTLLKPKSKRKGQPTRVSSVWHIRYYCPVRRRAVVISTLCKQRRNAERCLREFCDLLERGQVGTTNPFLLRRRLRATGMDSLDVDTCLEGFEADLRAGRLRRGKRKPVSSTHVALTLYRVRKVLEGCEIEQASELNAETVNRLLDQLEQEKKIKTAQTRRHHEMAVKAFGRWLVTTGRLDRDPLSRLVPTHVDEKDIVHNRGAFRSEEIEAIARAARTGPVLQGLTGELRSLLYVFAATTGLRAKECAAVRKRDFGPSLTFVRISGEFTKNRRVAVQPIPTFVRATLAEHIVKLDSDGFLWPGGWRKDERDRWIEAGWVRGKGAGEFLRTDAEQVNIVIGRKGREKNDGRVLDFHSFRHSYVSALSRAGVSEGLARKLARASCTAILERYTHTEFDELTAAVESMPAIRLSSENCPRPA